ncbi:MAG: Dabb family protein [Patescibacteria group bacterium]
MKQALWHVVLISFHGDTSLEERKMVWELYQSLAEDCGGEEAGIALFRVDWNLDLRKNVHLVEIAVFRDDAALQAFRNHPKHRKLTDIMRNIADWQVGDIHHPPTLAEIPAAVAAG